MTDCKHERIQTWRFPGDGELCGMWSCVYCARKFVPIDIQQEQNSARFQYLLEGSVERDDGWVIGGFVAGAPSLESLEDAIDAAIKATK
jgi:hypothetical protein